jgi:hypothetical protein
MYKLNGNNVSSTENSSDCKVVLETEKKTFFCNICNAAFNKITFLMVHSAKTHFRKDVDTIGEEASRNSLITSQGKHFCAKCPKSFDQIKHLMMHAAATHYTNKKSNYCRNAYLLYY